MAATQLAGTLIDGRYQVERLLGTGGMSAVYLARHLHLGRNCALKVLLPGRAAHPEAAARLEREAALASRISHPNICQVYDFGWTPDGLAWLAMEHLAGESLAAALASGAFPTERVTALVSGCAAGLAAAHAAGIIHRDLKPANVMLVMRDGAETPVIMDFGIAWSPEGEALTRDGMMVGTPEVMSPEQLAGDPVDARSDQYQLALLACRMLTGKLPFQGATTQETMVMRLTDRPASLADLRPGLVVGAGLQAVIERGLARRPADRYPDVGRFSEAFRESVPASGEAPTEVLPRLVESPGPMKVRPAANLRPGRWIVGAAAVILVGPTWQSLARGSRIRGTGCRSPPTADHRCRTLPPSLHRWPRPRQFHRPRPSSSPSCRARMPCSARILQCVDRRANRPRWCIVRWKFRIPSVPWPHSSWRKSSTAKDCIPAPGGGWSSAWRLASESSVASCSTPYPDVELRFS